MTQHIEPSFGPFLEAAPDSMVVVGLDGRIALVNGQAEALFGYDRGELVGQPVEILVPEHVQGIHETHRQGYFAAPVTRPMGTGLDLAGRRKDGTRFPVEISLAPIQTDEGMVAVAAIRDGTERRQVAIVNASADAIVSKALDGTVTSWNPGAEHLFGYRAVEMIGRSFDLLVPEGLREEERTLLGRAGSGGDIAEYETTRVHADGVVIDVAVTMSPVRSPDGRVRAISTITRDIRERKRAEAERQVLEDRLQRSERLESLGQLAGGIAHDFNNLLAVILNYAGFVAEEVADNEGARDDVEQIRKAAERAAALTHQLLTFARRETIAPEILDMNAVVADIETLLSRTIGEHVELVVHPGTDLPTVRADRGQMEQVLVNLAVNARDAMPGGGTLTIETGAVDLTLETYRPRPEVRPGRYVQVAVSDTGAGMDKAVIERAFEPFFSTKAPGQGTGLGLATVYGIVTEAGGTVGIYSELGLGTTIRVYLPATDRPATPARAPAGEPPAGGRGATVLVVEDEEAMRKVTARILRRNGYRVVEAAGADEALEALEAKGCDLLLTDVVMPEMSGRGLAEQARARWPGLPVLFMSGYSLGVLGPQRALEEGVELIQKPFNERALIEKVAAVLAKDGPGGTNAGDR